jgi:hypothetical protein
MSTSSNPKAFADLLRRLANVAVSQREYGDQLGVRILGARLVAEGGELVVAADEIEGRRGQVYVLRAVGWEPFHVVDGRERLQPIAPRLPVEAHLLTPSQAARVVAKARKEEQARAELRAKRKERERAQKERAAKAGRLDEIKRRAAAQAA